MGIIDNRSDNGNRFAIGLSFPEEYRNRVCVIADLLAIEFTKDRILYDKFHQAEFARANLDTYLQDLYLNETDLVVVFICQAYDDNDWCGVEWRALRSRINQGNDSSVMFLRLDDCLPRGLFPNVDGCTDIQRQSDLSVAELILKRYYQLKNDISSHRSLDLFPALKKHLHDELIRVRNDHPSFQLMEIDDSLFPKGVIEQYSVSAVNEEDENKSIVEIVEDSWSDSVKNHLLIVGEGGIGKTVTLLSVSDKFAPHEVPSVYVQLNELKGVTEKETIDEYIKDKYFFNSDSLFNHFHRLLDEPWNDGPQVILLLDGFNEIAEEKRAPIVQDIRRWSERKGVQIIMTSRYDVLSSVYLGKEYRKIVLQLLSREQVKHYLEKMSITPPVIDRQWQVISFPLMLTLYIKTEAFRQTIGEVKYQAFKTSNSAGAIIWNYLQREIWRFSHNDVDILKCILANEILAPSIAYQMQQNGVFSLEDNVFWNYFDQAYNHISSIPLQQFPHHIQGILRKNKLVIPDQYELQRFLEEDLHLFVQRRDDSYVLMHQQFRDALAAIHMINLSYSSEELPVEWKAPVDYYVMSFVSDLATQKEADRLWELNRESQTHDDVSTVNQLVLQRRLRNYDYSELNFSGLDLRGISLYQFKDPNTPLIYLPQKSELCTNLALDKISFYPKGHTSGITVIRVTADGKRCFSASDDKTVRVWNLESGQCIRVLEGHKENVTSLCISAEGKRCISATDEGQLLVWDVDKGICIKEITDLTLFPKIAISPNGKKVVVEDKEHYFVIWDIEKDEFIATKEDSPGNLITSVVFNPDGNSFVSSSWDNTVRIWDVETGNCLHSFLAHDWGVSSIVLSKNGDICISAGKDGYVRIWDLENRKLIHKIKEDVYEFGGVTIATNAKLSIGYAANNIFVWDLHLGKRIRLFNLAEHSSIPDDWISSFTITKDSRRVIIGTEEGYIIIWDLEVDSSLMIKAHQKRVSDIVIQNDQRFITGSEDCDLRIWNIDTCESVMVLEGANDIAVNDFSITPDGNRCISGINDGSIRIWDIETCRCVSILQGHKSGIKSIVVDSNGETCVSGAVDGSLKVWDIKAESCRFTLKEHESEISKIAITPDGRKCISKDNATIFCLWDLTLGKRINKIEFHLYGGVSFLDISPNGKRALFRMSYDQEGAPIYIFGDVEKDNRYRSFGDNLSAIAVSPDGNTVICRETWSNQLSVFRFKTGSNSVDRICLGIHKQGLNAAAVAPDGKSFICADGGRIRIFDLLSCEAKSVSKEEHDSYIYACAISPNSRFCVTAGMVDHTIFLWDMNTADCLKKITRLDEDDIKTLSVTNEKKCIYCTSNAFCVVDFELGVVKKIHPLPLMPMKADFSLSIIPDGLKETLRQNGAKV